MTLLFSHFLGQDGRSLKSVTSRLGQDWGPGLRTIDKEDVRELKAELAGGDPVAGERWIAIADAAATGSWRELVALLIEQNRSVMKSRGGTAWLEDQDGQLRVRFSDEEVNLPARVALPTLWRFPYFLDSVRAVARTLKGDMT